MQTYELIVKDRSVKANSVDMSLVRTSVGIDQVHVLFDNDEWLGFPITITFAQGDEMVTQALTMSEVTGSSDWVAEATVTVPYEVIDMVGPIRVTLQGTDSSGRHIITAKGSPLSVEEAGDVAIGDMPAEVPSVDQWNQAYANAVAAANATNSALESFQERIDGIVNQALSELQDVVAQYAVPATRYQPGIVIVGDGLTVNDEGRISTEKTNGVTPSQLKQLGNLAALAYYCFDTTFDDDGNLNQGATLKGSAIPTDGQSITVNDDGKLCVLYTDGDSESY